MKGKAVIILVIIFSLLCVGFIYARSAKRKRESGLVNDVNLVGETTVAPGKVNIAETVTNAGIDYDVLQTRGSNF